MNALEVVERLVEGPVLVFGSPPPEGRDLDLLVRPAEQRALEDGLPAHGFRRRGMAWARFAECTAEGLDVVPAATWGLPEDELARLFARRAGSRARRGSCAPRPTMLC